MRPFNLLWASPFANGFAIARSENGIGLLGPDGALRFELPYLALEPPHQDLVSFETYDRLKGYIDLMGNVRIPARSRHATQFSEGLAAVSEAINMDDWVYIAWAPLAADDAGSACLMRTGKPTSAPDDKPLTLGDVLFTGRLFPGVVVGAAAFLTVI